ncbi:pentatricopeptide repeat-containing protein At5g02830, chloroplastic isoform X1 [Phoenix dactylifera]|uniref:Pentatricopeptide repeat-containing protein At5g02830, chloroplastic isoform X1 n=1 Tax=Phoenix dactylifera TaxID=42345 RepID=A0A8B7C652_PHODC|nr:pentatricopeptide repeat-containing protein At5g02830, chloroplastic isoform X1 [Phoenix dactylifera]
MGDAAFLVASSILPHPKKPSSPPRRSQRRRPRPPQKPLLARPPLLSDVRRDLTAPSASASAADTRRLLKYYARLASKLARSGRLRDFLMVAESVLTSDAVAADAPQFVARISARMVSEGITSVLGDGNLEGVLDFVREAERLGISAASLFDESAMDTLAVECRRLVNQERLEEFVGLMETLAGYRLYIKDIADPVNILKKIVDPDMAVRYASVFPHSQLLLCSAIQEFGKKYDVTSAIRVFEALKQKSGGINMFACRSIIDICGICGDFLKSRSIFEDLLSQKITPNVYVFNSLMNVNAHDLSYTLHVYKHMQTLGVTADLTSYNILLKACCIAKRVNLAQIFFEEIKHMASRGVLKLDVFTYSTMIKVFADAKMWQMALNIKEDMLLSDVRPNIVTWSSLLNACANAGLADHAMQVFEEMLMAGCEPNTQCCNILLCAWVESCQYDRAFRLFYTWKETGLNILHAAKGGRYGGAGGCSNVNHPAENDSCEAQPLTVITVVPFRPTVATFNILMKACGTDYHRAKALMDEMRTMGLSPNHISWSVLIDIYGAARNVRGAIQAFKTMRDVGIKLDVVAYTTAIKACVDNKNLKIAFSLFEEMKRYQLKPNWVTYNTLLRARSRYGSLHEVQQCLAIYQDMRKAGYSSNDYYLKELIEEWCEGVLGNNNQSGGPLNINYSHDKGDRSKPYSLLLEKVAIHLQKDVGDNQAIDIRGLTKVEARIVVLSVLRMIKELYWLGKIIQDDMIIISGVGKYGTGPASREFEVQQAVLSVLQDELGFDVETGLGAVRMNHSPGPPDASNSRVFQTIKEPKYHKYLARRPQDLGVLRVPKRALHSWVQKKGSPSEAVH